MKKQTLTQTLTDIERAGSLIASYAREARRALEWAKALGKPIPQEEQGLEEVLEVLRQGYARLGALEGRLKALSENNSAEELRALFL